MITLSDLPIYIDIDGTLTVTPHRPWGGVVESRLARVREVIAAGHAVVIWSGGGTAYAEDFAERHGLAGAVCLGKPGTIVDDNPDIRPRDRMRVLSPGEFFD